MSDATLDFGITIPYYNGQQAFRTGGRFGGGGQSPVLSTPKIEIKQDSQGNLPKGYEWRGIMTEEAKHNIEWEIHLIPPPQNGRYWECETSNKGVQLWSFIQSLYIHNRTSISQDCHKWLTDESYKQCFLSSRNLKVRVFPEPDAQAFMNHLRAHEYQHVEDHAWLTYEILGPLDEWQQANRDTVFIASSKYAMAAVNIAGTAETANRIMDYWQRALERSGDLYHNSQAGAHPVLQIRRIARENDIRSTCVIDFTIKPAQVLRYKGFDLDDPRPHGWHLKKVFNVATGRLGGNEPQLDYRNTDQNNRRIVNFGHMIECQNSNYLALDDPESSDDNTFGSLFDEEEKQ
ncbi:hypothetical protein ACFQH5_00780 [Halomonas salifodinae]|uniref:Uncharacterized protein n=1 Tax=Halomonas salifodinae TaxID=438745 RepID=A0ABW2EQ13_9GAMM